MRLKPIFKNADARDHIFSPFRKSVVAQDRLCTKAHVRSDTMAIFLKVCDYLFCVRRMPARPCTQRAPVCSIRLRCPCMYGFCRLSRMSVLFCAPLRISCTFMHFFAHPCAVRTLTYAALSPHVRLLYALAHIGIVLHALAHILYVHARFCTPLRGSYAYICLPSLCIMRAPARSHAHRHSSCCPARVCAHCTFLHTSARSCVHMRASVRP